MSPTRPTKKQRELLGFIEGFTTEHGYGPSYREIMRALGYKSVSTVAIHIDNLITRGHLRKRSNSARSLEVLHAATPGSGVSSPTVTPGQEKWLVALIEHKFTEVERAKERPETSLDGLYVLVGALHVLGLDDAASVFKSRLQRLLD
jgi:SOS-response transcriptional repressor LexA